MEVVIVFFCVLLLTVIVPIVFLRWIFRVNVIVDLLENINAKLPDRPGPKELSAIQKSAEKLTTAVFQGIEKIKPDRKRNPSDITCSKCQADIPSGDQPHLFAGKVVCKKCDRKLREQAGLDDSVTTTK